MEQISIGLLGAPCKRCQDRYAECHSHCAKYAQFVLDNEEYKKRRAALDFKYNCQFRGK